MIKNNHNSIDIKEMKILKGLPVFFEIFFILLFIIIPLYQLKAQTLESVKIENMTFKSEGVILDGTVYKPKNSQVAVVIVLAQVKKLE